MRLLGFGEYLLETKILKRQCKRTNNLKVLSSCSSSSMPRQLVHSTTALSALFGKQKKAKRASTGPR